MPSSLFEEKYRPITVRDVLGNENHKKQLIPQIIKVKNNIKKINEKYSELEKEKNVENRNKILEEIKQLKTIRIRHQIFSGNAGVGKTTMAIAIGRDIFGDDFGSMFHEFNASDERSIAFVRETIKGLSQEGTGAYPFMIIFLDEIDNLTQDAQMALKRIIERARRVVFIGACNTIEEVQDPLKSRFTVRKFKNISMKTAVDVLEKICKKENIDVEKGFLEELYLTRSGDLRNCIGKLGEFADLGEKVTIDMIDEGKMKKEDIMNFYTDCTTGKLRKAFRFYQKMRIEYSINQNDFIESFMRYVLNLKRSNEFKSDLLTFVETFMGKRETDIMIMALVGAISKFDAIDKKRDEIDKTYEQK